MSVRSVQLAFIVGLLPLAGSVSADNWAGSVGVNPSWSSPGASTAEEVVRWIDPVVESFARQTTASICGTSGSLAEDTEIGGATGVHVIGINSSPDNGLARSLLSVLLAAGCFQLARHRQSMRLMWLPQWYHADAPLQIRHTVRFELQPTPAVACYQQGSGGCETLLGRLISEVPEDGPGTVWVRAASLRGPPLS